MLVPHTRMVTVDRGPEVRSRAQGRASAVRRILLVVSAALGLVGLFWIARSFRIDGKLRFGNPTELSPLSTETPDPQPRQVRAEVTRVRGAGLVGSDVAAGVKAGDKCEFLVERRLRERDSFYCNAQVVCGGRLLFGGPDRGYFACKLFDDEHRDVVGSDPNTTSADEDAAISLNTREGVMRIWDDARGRLGEFSLEAEILSIQ